MTLPNLSPKSFFGFTLVELLIVVTLMAILLAIMVGLFNNAQKKTRDSKRGVDIDDIANSLQGYLDPTKNSYTFTTANLATEFNLLPQDPKADSGGPDYCYMYSLASSTPPPDPIYGDWTNGCTITGGDWNKFSQVSMISVKSWKVCAKLEAVPRVYCQENASR